MAKSTSPNPKLTVLRQLCGKLAPTVRRYFGEIGRAQPSPASALVLRDDLVRSITGIITAELGKGPHPVVSTTEATPAGAHWLYESLGGLRNALHGRLPISIAFAMIDDDGQCHVGAVYFPLEDVLMIAETGSGSAGTAASGTPTTGGLGAGKFRVAGRLELADTLLLLPWHTGDVLKHQLLQKAEQASLHTRKTGHTLFDIIDVAAGRADAIASTRLSRIEALLANLILAEAGAFATDFKGQPLGPTSTTLLAANPKLHGKYLKLLNQPLATS